MTINDHNEMLLYVGTYGDEEHGVNDPPCTIYHFRMDRDTGALTPAGSTVGVVNPFYLKIDRQGRRVYVASVADETDGEAGGAVVAFSIDAESSALSFLNRQPSGGALPCYLTLDRTGRHLFVANYTSGSVASLPIDGDGQLGPPTDILQHKGSSIDSERQEGPHVHSIVLDPAERFAYAADLGIDQMLIYAFDAATGKLAPAPQPSIDIAAGAGPRHFAFHPSGRHAYLVNELNSTLTVFGYDDRSGALNEIQTLSALPDGCTDANYAADIKILPSGDFLYSSNRMHDSIAIFSIVPDTGFLEVVGHEPAGGSWPWDLAIDLTSRFLLAANYHSGKVAVFAIDRATGRLSPTEHEAKVPHPVCIEMMPTTA